MFSDHDDPPPAAIPPSGSIQTPNLKMFPFAELRSATRNFRPDTVLGEGGFGRVFKGYIDAETLAPSRVGVGMPVAVKKSNPDSEQGLKEWQVCTVHTFLQLLLLLVLLFVVTVGNGDHVVVVVVISFDECCYITSFSIINESISQHLISFVFH